MSTVVLVLVQVLLVIGLSRLMGQVCRALKQPLVIGEIIAGIMLGPSLLGLIAPDFCCEFISCRNHSLFRHSGLKLA